MNSFGGFQKYHDFIEVATEAISDVTVEQNGTKKPMWTRREVDEIVIAQVNICGPIFRLFAWINFDILQSTLFLIAGFDTTGTTLTNAIYLLTKNPDVQDRLYREIQERLEIHVL